MTVTHFFHLTLLEVAQKLEAVTALKRLVSLKFVDLCFVCPL